MAVETQRPNGDAIAAFIAAGVGCLTLGILVTAAELSAPIKDTLNVYNPVGPLSGKTLGAVIVWFITWVILHFQWRARSMPLGKWLKITWVLVGLGLLLTFPPIFTMFAAE